MNEVHLTIHMFVNGHFLPQISSQDFMRENHSPPLLEGPLYIIRCYWFSRTVFGADIHRIIVCACKLQVFRLRCCFKHYGLFYLFISSDLSFLLLKIIDRNLIRLQKNTTPQIIVMSLFTIPLIQQSHLNQWLL